MYSTAANGLRYCPACHRSTAVLLDPASCNTVCSDCTLPIGERYVDESFEWRSFAVCKEEDPSRDDVNGGQIATTTSADPMNADTNPATEGAGFAAPVMRGAVGAGITSVALPKMRGAVGAGASVAAPRIRGAVKPTPEKTLVEATNAINDMAERLSLSYDVKDRAKELFKKLKEANALPKGGVKCRNSGSLYAACLHTACRALGAPLTFKELASVLEGGAASGGVKEIFKVVKHIQKHLGDDQCTGLQASDTGGAMVRAGGYMHRFGAMLGMDNQEVLEAKEAAKRLEDALDVRRNPNSIAAGIIYMAIQRAGARKSMRDVSMVTSVSETTIKDVYQDLCPHAELLFG